MRAPLLVRTRSHATRRNDGSQTRFHRSSNRRLSSAVAQRCSFVWISSTRTRASSRLGHGTPIFTGDLPAFQYLGCGLAAALRHVRGFPALGLLRRLRPAATLPVDDAPARDPSLRPVVREASQRFPRSPQNRSTGSAPSYAPAVIHEYAADLPRGRAVGDITPAERPGGGPIRRRVIPLPSPHLPGSSWWVRLRGVLTLVSRVHLSVSLAEPGSSGSTDPPRRCQGCSRLPRRLPDQAALSFSRAAATTRRRWSFTITRFCGASWRTRSATQSWFGRSAVKVRCTRSAGRAATSFRDRGSPLAPPADAVEAKISHQAPHGAAGDACAFTVERQPDLAREIFGSPYREHSPEKPHPAENMTGNEALLHVAFSRASGIPRQHRLNQGIRSPMEFPREPPVLWSKGARSTRHLSVQPPLASNLDGPT